MTKIDLQLLDSSDGFETAGSNQSGMRDRNERLVLSILRRQGALPKAEIARKTGLSAQTVSVIMRALERDGLLQKGKKQRGKVGQPSVPMGLAPEGAFFLGLKVGRRSVELILVNFTGEELAHKEQSYSYPTPEMILEFVKETAQELCQTLAPLLRARIAGLGIATPFFLWEWATTIGIDADAMAGWKGFDLSAELDALFDFPVFLGNDASSACGAELVFGTTETPPDFLYIYVGYFVGGGVVLNGALYTGRSGNAGAIGTFPLSSLGGAPRQLVDAASMIGLERRLKAAAGDVRAMQRPDWQIDAAIVQDWLAEAVPALTHMIVGAISIIDFPAILIDGNMPESLRETLVARVTQELDSLPLSGLHRPRVMPGSLGPRARPLGAASLPLSNRFMFET